jgi:class 3 adenylate cyclase
LQQLAAAGETVLSAATREALAGPPSTVELPAQLVKGRDTPIIAYKIMQSAAGTGQASPAGSRDSATRTGIR